MFEGALNVPSLFPDSASRIPKSDPMEGRLQVMDFQYISIFIFISNICRTCYDIFIYIDINMFESNICRTCYDIYIYININISMLQDMLRYNMERTAGQALDTLGDSRRVRELLSVHNIGQRLFAK